MFIEKKRILAAFALVGVIAHLSCLALPQPAATTYRDMPRVSLITSLYKGDDFIEGFLADMVRQTIFNECELIIINANSPGNEEPIIQKYCDRYPNIIYERLPADPGIYGTWNYAIKKARAPLITNANLDDRRNPASLEMQAQALEQDPSVDLVYGAVLLTYHPHETFEKNSAVGRIDPAPFAPSQMYRCLPGPQPMWRASLHSRYGFFDESFAIAGDFEFWNRLASRGVRFKKIAGTIGLYYNNPCGLSTDTRKAQQLSRENSRISATYGAMWRVTP